MSDVLELLTVLTFALLANLVDCLGFNNFELFKNTNRDLETDVGAVSTCKINRLRLFRIFRLEHPLEIA